MESIYTELALYGSINKCARTDNIFYPTSEICDGTVSLNLECDIFSISISIWHRQIKDLPIKNHTNHKSHKSPKVVGNILNKVN